MYAYILIDTRFAHRPLLTPPFRVLDRVTPPPPPPPHILFFDPVMTSAVASTQKHPSTGACRPWLPTSPVTKNVRASYRYALHPIRVGHGRRVRETENVSDWQKSCRIDKTYPIDKILVGLTKHIRFATAVWGEIAEDGVEAPGPDAPLRPPLETPPPPP